jgi:hypothetical protein
MLNLLRFYSYDYKHQLSSPISLTYHSPCLYNAFLSVYDTSPSIYRSIQL